MISHILQRLNIHSEALTYRPYRGKLKKLSSNQMYCPNTLLHQGVLAECKAKGQAMTEEIFQHHLELQFYVNK